MRPLGAWPTREAQAWMLEFAANEVRAGRLRNAGALADAALMMPGGGSEEAMRKVLAGYCRWSEDMIFAVAKTLRERRSEDTDDAV